jgi:ABC-type lipoprotein export system ATPase subunit
MQYDLTDDLPNDLLIALFNVYKIYRTTEVETVALRGISLSLFKGEIVACIGPSGSGKTTMLNIIGGLTRPTAGIVFWASASADISRFEDNTITRIRNQFIGKVSQKTNLLPHLSVIQNVMLGGYISGRPHSELQNQARELLKRVDLQGREQFNPRKLSGGEKQRAAIAAALINQPQLVLADEPTGNLDYDSGETLLELIREINEDLSTTFFIVTHSKQVAAKAQQVIEIYDGILAGHHKDVNLDSLDQSRVITTDEQGRILLPKEITKQLPQSTQFQAFLSDDSIVLKPISSISSPRRILFQTEGYRKKVKCPICKMENPGKNILCSKCGSLLRKVGRF